MIDELNIGGVFLPASLVWAIIGGLLAYSASALLQRTFIDRYVWRTGLLDLALFFLFWWGVSALADLLLPLVMTH